MQTPRLRAVGVTKRFPGALALDAVDFTLMPGEVHALLGENGAGKSTLVKCLTGAHRRDGGEILLDGEPVDPRDTLEAQALGVAAVYQEVNLLPNLTAAENLFLGRQPTGRFGFVRTREMNRRARALLEGYGLHIDVTRELSGYSVAVRQLVAIARAADLSGKALILDEPTASLDAEETRALFGVVRRLRDRGLGIVFISHFLDQVFEISDRLTVLRNGRLVGSAETAGTSRGELVAMMLGRELETETHHHVAPRAAEATPAVRFRGFGRVGRIRPFDLDIRRGEVVGVAGLLGSGRTETAETMFGVTPHDAGTAEADGRTLALGSPRAAVAEGFGFLPEDRKTDGIVGDLSVRENIALALQARRGWARPIPKKEQAAIADRYIKALDIRLPDRETPIRNLSGGNQQKALLARWLATEPRFLILDEPTRGVDVGAHAEIIRLIEDLCETGVSLLVVSSELEELVAYSHRIVVLRDREHVAELGGEAVTVSRIVAAIAGGGAAAEREAAA